MLFHWYSYKNHPISFLEVSVPMYEICYDGLLLMCLFQAFEELSVEKQSMLMWTLADVYISGP